VLITNIDWIENVCKGKHYNLFCLNIEQEEEKVYRH